MLHSACSSLHTRLACRVWGESQRAPTTVHKAQGDFIVREVGRASLGPGPPFERVVLLCGLGLGLGLGWGSVVVVVGIVGFLVKQACREREREIERERVIVTAVWSARARVCRQTHR